MTFRKAERRKTKLWIGLSGPSGSGKTMSALLLATGMGKRIVLGDSEKGSGELYSGTTEYDYYSILPPYTVEKYLDLIEAAEKDNYDVLIIDSGSHVWFGEGGLLDLHDKITKASKTGNSFTAWKDVTPKYNRFINKIQSPKLNVIVTFRSKTDYIVETEGGKQRPRKVGLAPIFRDGIDYEFTTFFDLSAEHYAIATKDRTGLFAVDSPFIITAGTGLLFVKWQEGAALESETKASLSSGSHWIDNENTRKSFWARVKEVGLDEKKIHEILNVEHVKDFKGTFHDAGILIKDYLNSELLNRDEEK